MCGGEKAEFFFLRLGVFEPAKPELTGQTWAPELVPAGCECFMGEGGVWKGRLTKVRGERETAEELVGHSVRSCLSAELG